METRACVLPLATNQRLKLLVCEDLLHHRPATTALSPTYNNNNTIIVLHATHSIIHLLVRPPQRRHGPRNNQRKGRASSAGNPLDITNSGNESMTTWAT